MKKFFVLYKAPLEEYKKGALWTPAEQKESMDEWAVWMKVHADDLADVGAPVGKTKVVTRTGVQEGRNDVGGYSVVYAESHTDAANIFIDSPHLKRMNGSIEIMEIMEMPGM